MTRRPQPGLHKSVNLFSMRGSSALSNLQHSLQPETPQPLRLKVSEHERLLRDFGCGLCKKVLSAPLSMPCGHNFCKGCLDARFAGQATSVVGGSGYKTLRTRKVGADLIRADGGATGRPCVHATAGMRARPQPRDANAARPAAAGGPAGPQALPLLQGGDRGLPVAGRGQQGDAAGAAPWGTEASRSLACALACLFACPLAAPAWIAPRAARAVHRPTSAPTRNLTLNTPGD
jgi:hypothetical protein